MCSRGICGGVVGGCLSEHTPGGGRKIKKIPSGAIFTETLGIVEVVQVLPAADSSLSKLF